MHKWPSCVLYIFPLTLRKGDQRNKETIPLGCSAPFPWSQPVLPVWEGWCSSRDGTVQEQPRGVSTDSPQSITVNLNHNLKLNAYTAVSCTSAANIDVSGCHQLAYRHPVGVILGGQPIGSGSSCDDIMEEFEGRVGFGKLEYIETNHAKSCVCHRKSIFSLFSHIVKRVIKSSLRPYCQKWIVPIRLMHLF